MTKPVEDKTLLKRQQRIDNLLLRAEGFERYLNSARAQEVAIHPMEDHLISRTAYQTPRPRIDIGGQPIEHHHFELRELIRELREELETVNKMSNITVAQARRQLLKDLQEMPCPKSTSTEAKSL